MKLGIMQPYFMPYIGYWQLMAGVDKYVVYDDVNYIKGGWVSRNNILMNGQAKMFTILLRGASPNKLFNEIEILDNFKKFKRMLQGCYAKAPYFQDVMSLMETIFSFENKQLPIFLKNSYENILDYLDIKTELILSSDIEKDNTLKGKDKVLHICNNLGASVYYNAIGGQELYDKEEFAKNGVALKFLKTGDIVYKQYDNVFVPNLSILDVLMFNSVEEINIMLKKFELV